MKKVNSSTIRYILVSFVFAGIIAIPAFLTCIFGITGRSFDRKLKGNFDAVEKPVLSAKALSDGTFMTDFEKYFHNTFEGRGVLITTYNQIKHSVFNEHSGGYIGKDLIYEGYIKARLGLDDLNSGINENKENIDAFVGRLVEINDELNKLDKHLIVIRALNKADYMSDGIPKKYYYMKSDDGIPSPEYFDSLMKESGITYFNTKEYVDSLDLSYPIFYKSSHHWSRPVEVEVENRLFEIIEENTDHKMERYKVNDVGSVDFPIDRDGDVLELINIWTDTGEIYYRYNTEAIIPDEEVNICVQGDSYTTYICQDMVENGHNGIVTNIFYDEMYYEGSDISYELWHDFSKVDFEHLVNDNDIFVICYTDNNLCFCGYGYTEALLSYLKR